MSSRERLTEFSLLLFLFFVLRLSRFCGDRAFHFWDNKILGPHVTKRTERRQTIITRVTGMAKHYFLVYFIDTQQKNKEKLSRVICLSSKIHKESSASRHHDELVRWVACSCFMLDIRFLGIWGSSWAHCWCFCLLLLIWVGLKDEWVISTVYNIAPINWGFPISSLYESLF